jgi:MoxR-like ATPase
MQAMLLSKQHVPNVTITLEELEEAKAEVDNVEISPEIIKVYLDVWSLCRQKGFDITDRVFRQGLDIIKAEAWLNGRDKVNEEDFEILQHVFWKDPKKRRDVHLEILNATNPQKSKIAEIYHEADKLIKDALKNPNAENASEKGLELLRKVKPRLQQMDKLIDEMAKTGKDTREPRKMLETLSRGLEDVTRECVGFVGFNRSK